MWPKIVINEDLQVVETLETYGSRSLAQAFDHYQAPRIRDGVELVTLADPETWVPADYDKQSENWTERSVILMSKLYKAFEEKIKMVSDYYVLTMGESGERFQRIYAIGDDHITVEYSSRGCLRGCCPDEEYSYDIPIQALWDTSVIDNMKTEKEKAAQEKKAQEIKDARDRERQRKKEREENELKEYHRLMEKYKGN
jgi:hypothetical protein